MAPFHHNKLNTVGLEASDDEDDQSYTPVKKSAKGKQPARKSTAAPKTTTSAMRSRGVDPKPKPTVKAASEKKSLTAARGFGNAKRNLRDAGKAGTLYEDYNNQNNDSGIDGMPYEPMSQTSSTNSNALAYHPDPRRTLTGNHSKHDAQLALNGTSGADLSTPEWPLFALHGDQHRINLSGFDIGQLSTTYPGAPRNDAFPTKDNRDMFQEVPGNLFTNASNQYLDMFGGLNNTDVFGDNGGLLYAAGVAKNQSLQGAQYNSFGVPGGMDVAVKKENEQSDQLVSSSLTVESEYEESDLEDYYPRKVPKINKDGAPRKPRQPRPKLLKWDDNDWKNVALGIVWACGENGIAIPFDQAAQIVSESCTAGALQQALLKLRLKQISEGFQIPLLKMAWTRKRKQSITSTADANNVQDVPQTKTTLPRKKPTRFEGNQSLIVTLKRAYQEADRMHLVFPYKGSASSSNTTVATNTDPDPFSDFSGYHARAESSSSDEAGVPNSLAAGAQNSLTAGAQDHHLLAGMMLDGTIAGVTEPMPQDFNTPIEFLSSDPQLRHRKTVVFGARSGTYMAPSSINPGQSPATGLLSSAHNTAPSTPADNSVYESAFGTPLFSSLYDSNDDSPVFGSTFDHSSISFGARGQMPVTPPPSATANRIITDRLNSSLREDGAFNPQANRADMFRATFPGDELGDEDMEDWSRFAHQINFMVDNENDGNAYSGNGLDDPFCGGSSRL